MSPCRSKLCEGELLPAILDMKDLSGHAMDSRRLSVSTGSIAVVAQVQDYRCCMVVEGWTVNRIGNVGGFLRLSLDEMYLTGEQEGSGY